jgi:hypothetical protein
MSIKINTNQFNIKIQILIFFLSSFWSLYSQKPQLIIPNQNQLYFGIENQCNLRIFEKKDYIIKPIDTINVKIHNSHYFEYNIFVRFNNNHSTKILIGEKNKNQIKWIDTVEFEVKKLPEYSVFIEGYSSDVEKINLTDFPSKIKLLASSGNNYIDETFEYKVLKFELFYLPDKNEILQFFCLTDTVSETIIKNIKSKLTPNSMLLFDRIYIKDKFNNTKKLESFYIYYNKNFEQNLMRQNNCDHLIQGYIRKNGKLYNYNLNSYSMLNNVYDTLRKDSIWKYSIFNENTREFNCYKIDSFSNNKLLKSYFWNDNGLSIINYFNDSFGELVNFYKSGVLHQKGNVVFNSNYINYTYLEYCVEHCSEDWSCNHRYYNQDSIYIYHLNDLEKIAYPIGHWKIYDKNGKLTLQMNFSKKEIDETYLKPFKCYQIIPFGECFIYDEKGKIVKRINFEKPKN